MSGRATFGDFAQAARARLNEAIADDERAERPWKAAALARQGRELVWSLRAATDVMARYLTDVNTPYEAIFDRRPGHLPPWARAGFEAQAALGQAAALLEEVQLGPGRPSGPFISRAAQQVVAAASAMRYGRDLLHTHFGLSADGFRVDRSEWAPAVSSNPVTRAMMLEVGLWARQTAEVGASVSMSARSQLHVEFVRRNVNAASQWLWAASTAITAAHRQVPEPAADMTLLHAIPVNQVGPRQTAREGLTVAALCRGAVNSAERVRHLVRRMAETASWAPGLTVGSLRQTAASAAVIGHHCQILLRTLAERAATQPYMASDMQLLASAEAAGQFCQAWVDAARSWDTATTSTRGALSAVAVEAADLALWTGRLAYVDPRWSLSLGPSQQIRSAEQLIDRPADFPQVVSAVHQACETVTHLAAAEQNQIAAAGKACRLLVTTRSLPDTFDVPRPFAVAPKFRVDQILATYGDAGIASAQATDRVAETAMEVGAPSKILAAAHAATRGMSAQLPVRSEATASPDDRQHVRPTPGPVEQTLRDLDVVDPAVLSQAAAIDQAAEQLILEHAQRAITPGRQLARGSGRSTATAQLANHLLASSSPPVDTPQIKPAISRSLEAEIEP